MAAAKTRAALTADHRAVLAKKQNLALTVTPVAKLDARLRAAITAEAARVAEVRGLADVDVTWD